MRNIFFIVITSFLLTSCGGSYKDYIPFMGEGSSSAKSEWQGDLTDEELYANAIARVNKGSYKSAIENFQEIERLYPFSKLAIKAQVMVAYVHYKSGDYDDAIIVIDRFSKLNPGNKDIGYMYYLKALSYYERITDVKRDQKITKQALNSLLEVINRFPNSEYARDGQVKLDLVRDHLAGKEMEIARFYLKRKKYIAAINRFSSVIKEFENTSHVEEALYRLTESYLSLGLFDEAKKNASVLGHNYPQSKWYKYAYAITVEGKNSATPQKNKSWISKVIPFIDADDEAPLPKDNKADSFLKRLFQ